MRPRYLWRRTRWCPSQLSRAIPGVTFTGSGRALPCGDPGSALPLGVLACALRYRLCRLAQSGDDEGQTDSGRDGRREKFLSLRTGPNYLVRRLLRQHRLAWFGVNFHRLGRTHYAGHIESQHSWPRFPRGGCRCRLSRFPTHQTELAAQD